MERQLPFCSWRAEDARDGNCNDLLRFAHARAEYSTVPDPTMQGVNCRRWTQLHPDQNPNTPSPKCVYMCVHVYVCVCVCVWDVSKQHDVRFLWSPW